MWVDDVDLADLADLPYVDIELRDAHGRRWWRYHGGHLRRASRPGSRPASGAWRVVTRRLAASYVAAKNGCIVGPTPGPLRAFADVLDPWPTVVLASIAGSP